MELSQELLDRLRTGEPGRKVNGRAIAETAKLLGIEIHDPWGDGHNRVVNWLDEYYPLWRGYEVNYRTEALRSLPLQRRDAA